MISPLQLSIQRVSRWFIAIFVLLVSYNSLRSEESTAPSAESLRFFEAHVRPLLIERCWKCHSEEETKGGLRLDARQFILDGGDSGAAVDLSQPKSSLLLEAVRYESLEMPPNEKLPDSEIAILTRWVELGMPWPGSIDQPAAREKKDRFDDEDRAWWAIQPLDKPTPPEISSTRVVSKSSEWTDKDDKRWQSNPIDAFILHKMASAGLHPAPEADRASFIRRVTFDLVGLPPSFDEVQAFVNDESPNAVEELVDRLLDSPRYGERWARHWLDLVRYADSDGYRIDHYRPNAWLYRDYVINSLNQDKPYDRFVQEQLAGDELFPEDPQAQVATGYLRHWIYEYNNRDAKGQWNTILNDITDTTSDVFLGLGLQCAKCHDHKFDPLLQRDYFRLQAFFAPLISTQTVVSSASQRESYQQQEREWLDATVEIRAKIEAIEAKLRDDGTADAISKFPPDIQAILKKPEAERSPYEKQIHEIAYRQILYEHERLDTKAKGEAKEQLLALRKELAAFDSLKPKPLLIAMTASDVSADAPEILIPKRGKQPVSPGFPTLIDPTDAVIDVAISPSTSGRRAALARWITDAKNPLTSRVIVNRVWQVHFGRGLAANASDFGKLGGEPSHPDLLNWLASTFIEDGWSLKKLHKRIVLSQVYRQSTHHPKLADFQTKDPNNDLYWRSNTRRLEAEQIRDSILAVTGELVHAEVVSVPPDERRDGITQRLDGSEGVPPDVPKRSIYTRQMRNARDPLLDVFDLPLFFSSESSRNNTTTPVQSLLLFNSSEMLRFAGLMAERLEKTGGSIEDQIRSAYQIALGRNPRDAELARCLEFMRLHREILQQGQNQSSIVALEQRQTGKIPYRDGQAVFVSHDDMMRPLMVKTRDTFSIQPWTIEAFFQIRSIREDATVRTIVSKWSGQANEPGWSFGVTGKGSRRKPQTLVVVMWGELQSGKRGEAAIFSDQFVDLNKPYFAAAAVEPASDTKPGHVTFYLKDLSNDDEPLSVVKLEHQMKSGFDNEVALTIGGCGGSSRAVFDGLIDDIRLSEEVVPESRLILTSETVTEKTIGYWRFDPDPGLMKDSSKRGIDLVDTRYVTAASANQVEAANEAPAGTEKNKNRTNDVGFTALTDLCHAILNSNEFLYVE